VLYATNEAEDVKTQKTCHIFLTCSYVIHLRYFPLEWVLQVQDIPKSAALLQLNNNLLEGPKKETGNKKGKTEEEKMGKCKNLFERLKRNKRLSYR